MNVQLQYRMYPESLHIQGKGPSINREYGVSADIPLDAIDEELVKRVADVERTQGSFATDKKYAPCTAELVEGPALQGLKNAGTFQSELIQITFPTDDVLQLPSVTSNLRKFIEAVLAADDC